MFRLLLISLTVFLSELVFAAELLKIEVRYLTSYKYENLSPSKLYLDLQRGELYFTGQNEIIIIDEDGIVVHRVSLAKSPRTFCVTRDGDIYIADDTGGINILNYRGEFKGKFDLSSVPEYTSLIIQSLYIDENDNLYVGDQKLSRIIVLDNNRKFLFQFGKKGNGEGEFLNASSITTDKERLYLLDPALFRVSVYNKKDGKFIFKFGQMSSLLGGFSQPSAIDTDGERLFVVDTNRFVVTVFDKEGKPIIEFGGIGQNPENLLWPSDVKVDKKGRIYVCAGKGRVNVYELITPEPKADW